jgi:hypothetical protein
VLERALAQGDGLRHGDVVRNVADDIHIELARLLQHGLVDRQRHDVVDLDEVVALALLIAHGLAPLVGRLHHAGVPFPSGRS